MCIFYLFVRRQSKVHIRRFFFCVCARTHTQKEIFSLYVREKISFGFQPQTACLYKKKLVFSCKRDLYSSKRDLYTKIAPEVFILIGRGGLSIFRPHVCERESEENIIDCIVKYN